MSRKYLALAVVAMIAGVISGISISQYFPNIKDTITGSGMSNNPETIEEIKGTVYALVITSDDKYIVSGSADKNINIWDIETLERVYPPLDDPVFSTRHRDWVTSLAIAPPNQLVSGSIDSDIRFWKIEWVKKKPIPAMRKIFKLNYTVASSVAISQDGKTIVSGYGDNITIWNESMSPNIQDITEHKGTVYALALSPDGKTVVSGSRDKTIKIWNLTTDPLKPENTLKGHDSDVLAVAITPDGETVVSGSRDKTIKIWNLSTGELIRTLEGHDGAVSSLAITPDGKTLVSGSRDKTIKIWDMKTGELSKTLEGHKGGVSSLALTRDGKTLVSGSVDETIKIWSMS